MLFLKCSYVDAHDWRIRLSYRGSNVQVPTKLTALDLQVLCAPTVYICKQNGIVAIVFNKVWAVYAVEESIEAGSRSLLVAGYRG